MDYFAGLDISMEETHVCVVDRDGAVVRESKVALHAGRHRRGAGESAGLSAHRIRDRPDGADALPRADASAACRWSASRAGRPIRR